MSEIQRLVMADTCDNLLHTPGSAISVLRRITGTQIYSRQNRPCDMVDSIMDSDPDLITRTLSPVQVESILIMVLSGLLVASLEPSSSYLDGRRLLLAWEDLSDAAHAIFPSGTDQAIRRLAEIATAEAEIILGLPSKMAQALLMNGELVRRLNNGGLYD